MHTVVVQVIVVERLKDMYYCEPLKESRTFCPVSLTACRTNDKIYQQKHIYQLSVSTYESGAYNANNVLVIMLLSVVVFRPSSREETHQFIVVERK